MRTFNRTHPLFPTHAEIVENPNLLYSDHLPVLFDVPVESENNTGIRVISWNVLGHNAPSGFHTKMRGWEEEVDGRNRYKRIIGSLKTFAQTQNPDVIVLQEATPEFLGALITELPDWTIRNNNAGAVILFKSKDQGGRLEIKEYAVNRDVKHNGVYMQDCQSAVFEVDGHVTSRIKVNNVHTAFYHTPEHHEAYYQHLLNQEDENIVTLVVGDMNSRIAPQMDATPQNIATGVVPGCFNGDYNAEQNVQMTDFPDAAFTRNENGRIQQLDRKVLDYKTGQIFQAELNEHQDAVPAKWHQFRMIMCLDNFKRAGDKIEGKNVFEFQGHLAHYFPNSNVLVRKAAKDNNERGFGFRFSKDSPVFKLIQKTLAQKFQDEPSKIQCVLNDDIKSGQRVPIVFVHSEKMPEFLAVINPVIEALQSIDRRIENLRKSWINPFMKSGENKIDRLLELRTNILTSIGEKPLSEIISTWETQQVSVDGVNKSTSEIMSERRNKFVGTFFYRKPPPASETETVLSNLKKLRTSAQESSEQQPEGLNNNNNFGH